MLGSVNRDVLGSRFPLFAVLHISAAATGGLLVAVALQFILVSLAVPIGDGGPVAVAVAVVVVGSLIDLRLLRLPYPSSSLQVPEEWRRELRPSLWVPAYGLLLGLTVATRSPATVLGTLLGASLVLDLDWLVVFGLTLGAVRGSLIFTKLDPDSIAPHPSRVLTALLMAGWVLLFLAV